MTAEYSIAVHGLVFLLHKDRIVTSEELAVNICTNPAKVRKVMAKLKQGGLVSSSEGKGSGYHSVEHAADITLYQVLDVLGERMVTSSWHSGNVDMECLIASGMSAVMDGIYQDMNGICQEYLSKITIGAIQEKIFTPKQS